MMGIVSAYSILPFRGILCSVCFFFAGFIIIIICNGSSRVWAWFNLVNTFVLLALSVDVSVEGQQIFAGSFF